MEATLLGPPVGSKSAVLEKCSVTDHQNGSYSVQLVAHHAGKWTLQVRATGYVVQMKYPGSVQHFWDVCGLIWVINIGCVTSTHLRWS